MVTIIFESHGTTFDNEAHLASGRYDVELSPLGIAQSKALGERYRDQTFDAIFCSDLQRSYRTGEVAFADRGFSIIKDQRLSECDYGEWTRRLSDEVEKERPHRVDIPFPGGKSYQQCAEGMKSFLDELIQTHNGKKVMVIGSRATQFGLEHWINHVPLADAVNAPWKWQPGWKYELS